MTAKELRRFLKDRKLEQVEFAEILDVHDRQVRRWLDDGPNRWLGKLLELVEEGRLDLDELGRK